MAASQEALKKLVGYTAVDRYVSSGMTVGLGTGSTAKYVVERIGAKLRSGELTKITGVPTSAATEDQARAEGIPLMTLDQIFTATPFEAAVGSAVGTGGAAAPVCCRRPLDVAIDGADEVCVNTLGLVKGRGGALLREKMVAECSKQFVVVVDDSKLVRAGLGQTGAFPVEINKYCHQYIIQKLLAVPSLAAAGVQCRLRCREDDGTYETDNSNVIADVYLDRPIADAVCCAAELRDIVGVVEHGLFLNMATVCLVADSKNQNVQTITL